MTFSNSFPAQIVQFPIAPVTKWRLGTTPISDRTLKQCPLECPALIESTHLVEHYPDPQLLLPGSHICRVNRSLSVVCCGCDC